MARRQVLERRREQLYRWLKESQDPNEQRTISRAIDIINIDIQHELERGDG